MAAPAPPRGRRSRRLWPPRRRIAATLLVALAGVALLPTPPRAQGYARELPPTPPPPRPRQSALRRPHLLFVMADDLGHGDLGRFNGGRTHTPAIDALIADGLTLSAYYTFKICSPSRASLHTGRYPWGIGWYDMRSDGDHCTSEYTLLPALLREQGYATHALGKWDVGFAEARCHPTRHAHGGYDTWLGYYEACLQDYWSHTFGLGTTVACQPFGANVSTDLKDLSNCTGSRCVGVAEALTGTYNARAFTGEAVRIIEAHGRTAASAAVAPANTSSLFIYLAYHNVHLACGASYGTGLHAPCSTVRSAPHERIPTDTFKLQAAMLTELDYGVGNTTAALQRAGLWEDSVVIFTSDNGGPLNHGTNAPYRGGKWTFFEGGVNVACFVSGPALHLTDARRGTTWDGLAHVSDWYVSLVVGAAGGTMADLTGGKTGPREPDGYNLWPALLGGSLASLRSPREEVVHQVNNSYFTEGVQSMRWRQYKLIRSTIKGGPGDSRIVGWPAPAPSPVAFGLSGGTVGKDVWPAGPDTADHCRANIGKRQKGTIDCQPFCLFDLVADPTESHDLAGSAAHAELAANISARLDAHGATGRDPQSVHVFKPAGSDNWTGELCKRAMESHLLTPLDQWDP